MTEMTNAQLTHEVDALTEEVRQMKNLLALFMTNGLADAFDGTGNQTYGGGVMRLDQNGIQIKASDNYDQRGGLYIVPTFQSKIPLVSGVATPAVGQWVGIVGNAAVDDNRLQFHAKNVTNGRTATFSLISNGTTNYAELASRYLATDNFGTLRLESTSVSSRILLSAGLALFGVLSPAQITANQNDYAPAGILSSNMIRLTSDAARDITGITGIGAAVDGQMLALVNVGGFTITLKDESASSAAGNRFALKADIALATDGGAVIVFDQTSQRWRCLGTY